MINVVIGLIPGTLAYTWFFGPGILINILIAVLFALGFEAFVLRIRKKRIKPHQVGQLMMGLKLYRTTRNFKADNYTDLSIYGKMTKEVHKKEVAKKDKV